MLILTFSCMVLTIINLVLAIINANITAALGWGTCFLWQIIYLIDL